MINQGYSTIQVAKITGFTQRQLDYWAKEKIVVPSIQISAGSGTRKIYSFDDLVELRLISQLKKCGWSTQKIRKAICQLSTLISDPNPSRSVLLTHSSGMLIAICKTAQGENIFLDALNPSGQQVMSIVVEKLSTETESVLNDFLLKNNCPESIHGIEIA